MTAGVAALLAGGYHVGLIRHRLPELQILVLAFVFLDALSNLTGLPKKAVEKHWEKFGPDFLPFPELGNHEKRVVVGFIQMTAILSTLMDSDLLRAYGYGAASVLYGRSAMVNTHMSPGKALTALAVCASSAALMLAELEPMAAANDIPLYP